MELGTKENKNDVKLIEKLNLLLYPETLDCSKVCSILTDDLTFKLDDLLKLGEIQKITTDKNILISLLNEVETHHKVIEKDKNDDNLYHILLFDNFTLYNLINVPNKITKRELLLLLNLNNEDIVRLYKQSLFWILICENPSVNSVLEEKLKNIIFEDDKILKFETTPSKAVKKNIYKKMQHLTYLKDTNELKANSPGIISKEVIIKRESCSNEAFSWRKKK